MRQQVGYILKSYIKSYKGLPIESWHGITLTFVNSISVGLCFFLSLYFVDILKFDIASAGMFISFYGLGTVIGGIISGKLCDHFSPRHVSIVSLILQSIAFVSLTKINSPVWIALDLLMLGIASYGFKTSNNVWMLASCNDQATRAKTINVAYAGSNLGLGVSGIIIGLFASFGYEVIFYFFSMLLFLSALYLLSQKTNLNEPHKIITAENTSVKKIINLKILTLVLGCVFLIGLIVAQLSSTYPIYVQEAFPALGTKAVSILFILDTFLIVMFQAPLMNLLSKYNKLIIIGAGTLLMGLGMLILSGSFVFTLAIISCFFWTTGEMLFFSTAQLVCYEKGPEKKKGHSMGVFQSTYATSIVIGPTIGGFIYQYAGKNTLWYLSGLIGVVCFIACYYHRRYD